MRIKKKNGSVADDVVDRLIHQKISGKRQLIAKSKPTILYRITK